MDKKDIALKMLMKLHGELVTKNFSEFGNSEYNPTNDLERLAFKVGFENHELSAYDITFINDWYPINEYDYFEKNYDLNFHESYALKLGLLKHKEFNSPPDPYVKELLRGRRHKT